MNKDAITIRVKVQDDPITSATKKVKLVGTIVLFAVLIKETLKVKVTNKDGKVTVTNEAE